MQTLSGLSGRLSQRESDFTPPLRDGRAKRGAGRIHSAARLTETLSSGFYSNFLLRAF